jgi:hypothetical protein
MQTHASIPTKWATRRERIVAALVGTAVAIVTFPATLAAQSTATNLLIKGDHTELSASTNGATVTPTISAGGMLGQLVVSGSGSVNFTPAAVGDGVFFLNCCSSANRAYYKFQGALVGSIFSLDQGQISFFIKSRYSFAQRQQTAASPRYAFDVRDNEANKHLFYFLTQVASGRLVFSYSVGGASLFYYVPAGMEDALLGSSVILKVTLAWNGTQSQLYLNDALVQSITYVKRSATWSSSSQFDLGAFEYSSYGGYNASDDAVDEFAVVGPQFIADTTPPVVAFATPLTGAQLDGLVPVSINASDASGIDRVQFQVDGVNLGVPLTGAGRTFSVEWDTATYVNGPHTLSATATDVFGNVATVALPVSVSHQFLTDTRVYTSIDTNVYSSASAQSTLVATVPRGAFATITSGPVIAGSTTWWYLTFDTGISGWTTEDHLLVFVPLSIAANTWVVTRPAFTGAPDGGGLYPQGWVNKAAYDPRTHRVIFSDRWQDPVRGYSIFANGIYAYDPLTNVFEVQKLNNWYVDRRPDGGYQTTPLPANATDPTPPDHHPLTGVELVPELNAVFTANGVNSISLPDLSILNATWKLDLASRHWTQVSTAQNDPNYPPNNPGSPSGLVYDPIAKRLVYFIPSTCGCSGTDTYLFDPATNRWTLVAKDPSSFNVNIAGAGVAYDSRRGLVLALGGNNYITASPTPVLWAYSVAQNRWTRLADAPVSAMAPAFAYDTKEDVFLALIGNVTFIYDPTTQTWRNFGATIQRPANLQKWQAVAYDVAYDVFVFEGGSYNAPLFALFRYDPAVSPPGVDTVPPSASITTPVNGSTVAGIVNISASASDDVGLAGVQFQLNGANLGDFAAGAGPSFSISWNSGSVVNGSYNITAVAHDLAGNVAASTVVVTVANASVNTPPVISRVAAGSVSATGATISWTTDKPANSQVIYGVTTAYGSASTVDQTLVTTHAVTVTDLAPSTTYHYQVASRDAQGLLATSADLTFTTSAALVSQPVLLHLAADASEVSGVFNNATITPATAPAGFTGTVLTKGAGTVNFAPAQTGTGVYFLQCCDNTATAYYKFTGSTIGQIFNVDQGQISFYLKSRYSFAQRPAGSRYVFDVRDNNASNHVFYFRTQVSSGRLLFAYSVGGGAKFYYVPAGMEDALFGNGVTLKVSITWDGSVSRLYLNDVQAQSASYTKMAPTWTASSVFDLGAYEYLTYGGYNVLDDIVDEFTVQGPAIVADVTAPSVAIAARAAGSPLRGAVTLTVSASDTVAVSSVRPASFIPFGGRAAAPVARIRTLPRAFS